MFPYFPFAHEELMLSEYNYNTHENSEIWGILLTFPTHNEFLCSHTSSLVCSFQLSLLYYSLWNIFPFTRFGTFPKNTSKRILLINWSEKNAYLSSTRPDLPSGVDSMDFQCFQDYRWSQKFHNFPFSTVREKSSFEEAIDFTKVGLAKEISYFHILIWILKLVSHYATNLELSIMKNWVFWIQSPPH